MSVGMHKVKVQSNNGITNVWLDDMKLVGLVGLDTRFRVDEVPIVHMDFAVKAFEIDIDNAAVVQTSKESEENDGE